MTDYVYIIDTGYGYYLVDPAYPGDRLVRMIALKDTGQNLRIGPNVIRRLLCAPLLR